MKRGGKGLRIELAGYNIEAEIIEKAGLLKTDTATPEVFSSAYARISRSSEDIASLRRQARNDIGRARKANQRIIFDMGHHSVAEHAVFNFDIIGVSRLALEEIEKFRLASYTEKSQRYVTLAGDYVLPGEIGDDGDRALFHGLVAEQNAFYRESFEKLKDYWARREPELFKTKGGAKDLENLAKEDARYILSLATEGQVGMTINGRNLEHLFRRFAISQRLEVQKIGRQMFALANNIAPSLFLFPEPSLFERDIPAFIKAHFAKHEADRAVSVEPVIVEYTKNGDDMILAGFLAIFQALDYGQASRLIAGLQPAQKETIFKDLFNNMEFFDSPPREFELPDITFQAVISASAFAQLKRHRIATLLAGEYRLDLGYTIPRSLEQAGLSEEFSRLMEKTAGVFRTLEQRCGRGADYILTNAHRRMVLMKMNLREVYHFARLRADDHAQWEIRQLAQALVEEVKRLMPYSSLLLCGKSEFAERFDEIYHKKPGYMI